MTSPRPPLLPGLPSDHLVAPLNAPRAGNVSPGVQPGVSGAVVLAQYVIVFGTSGGVFIYAGTPALGNAPIYSMANAAADPYGNTVKPGIWAGQPGSIQIGMQTTGAGPGGIAELFMVPVGTFASDAVLGLVQAGGQAIVELVGAKTTASGAQSDQMVMFVYDHGAGTSAALVMQYDDAAGGATVYFQVNYQGLFLGAVWSLTGVVPGTGTSSANPAVAESWHTATLQNSWTGGGGGGVNGLFYRFTADGEVEVMFDLINATATGNSVCATLPAGYRPATNLNLQIGWNNPQASNAASAPWLNVSTGGALQITGLQVADKEVFGRVKFPVGVL